MENKLNHFDQKGNAVMVDVSGKSDRCGDGGAYWCECGTFDNL